MGILERREILQRKLAAILFARTIRFTLHHLLEEPARPRRPDGFGRRDASENDQQRSQEWALPSLVDPIIEPTSAPRPTTLSK